MASLEARNGQYRLVFRYQGQKFQARLDTDKPNDAEAICTRVERRLQLLTQGDIVFPAGADFVTFLLSDGKQLQKPVVPKLLTLGTLFHDYEEHLKGGETRWQVQQGWE